MKVCITTSLVFLEVILSAYNLTDLIFTAEKMFVRLEAAKVVLLDKEKRSKYDQWRSGGFKRVISFKDWLAIQSKVHSVSAGHHIIALLNLVQ